MMQSNTRVLANTIVLYIQMILSVCVSLFSSRWILAALGADDFGLFNLVGGMIIMLAFLNVAMAGATQRFLSFTMGKKDIHEQKKVFYYSQVMHAVISLIILVLIELVGTYLVNHVFVIPEAKMDDAMLVLHCLSVSTLFTVNAAPFQAVLNAHENMLTIALISLTESILKLMLAYYLLTYEGNRLRVYAVLMMCIPVLSAFFMYIYCTRKYQETHIRIEKITDRNYFKDILQYAGWNLLGTIANMCRSQGVSMVLNLFGGVKINAAYGIANQVNGQASHMSYSIVRAVRPVIIREQGAGHSTEAVKMAISSCKATFLLYAMAAIPLIVEMPFILDLWLGNYPAYTIDFCRYILVISLVDQLTPGLFIAIEGTGKIGLLQVFVSTAHIMIIPLGVALFFLGFPPLSVLQLMLVEELTVMVARIYITHRQLNFNATSFYTRVILPLITIGVIAASIGLTMQHYLSAGLIRLFVESGCIIISIALLSYTIVLNTSEKILVKQMISKLVKKLKR